MPRAPNVVGPEAASRLGQILRDAFGRDGAVHDPRVEVRHCSTAAVLTQAGLGLSAVDPYTASVHASPHLVQHLSFRPARSPWR